MNDFFVAFAQITEADYTEWVTEETNVPGLCLADKSLDKLIAMCKSAIPELLAANTTLRGDVCVHFRVNENLAVEDLVA